MINVFDTVLTSSDLSIERVLQTGKPAVLLFYDNPIAEDLHKALDELASRYAGRALIVLMPVKESAQTAERFGAHRSPTLVTFRNGNLLVKKEYVRAGEVEAQIQYLLGEGPLPANTSGASTQTPPGQGQQAKGSGPIQVDESTFEREVLQADRPVLVDFWAVWCGPCRMMEPALERLSREKADKLKVTKLNVDENPDIAGRYNVSGIPTMIVVQNGREVDRLVGALPEGALRNRLARWI
jgi:thioredoxin